MGIRKRDNILSDFVKNGKRKQKPGGWCNNILENYGLDLGK